MLDMFGLLHRAMRCRDGRDDHDAAELHSELTPLQKELDAAGRPADDRLEADTVAAVAAALILGPSRGADVSDTALARAARELLDVACRQAGHLPAGTTHRISNLSRARTGRPPAPCRSS